MMLKLAKKHIDAILIGNAGKEARKIAIQKLVERRHVRLRLKVADTYAQSVGEFPFKNLRIVVPVLPRNGLVRRSIEVRGIFAEGLDRFSVTNGIFPEEPTRSVGKT